MSLNRLIRLFVLLALLLAPFGRMAAAEAMAMPHQAAAAMPGHCDDMPAPPSDDGDAAHKASLHCLVACAAMAGAEAISVPETCAAASPLAGFALPQSLGLHPEADPPPPRRS